MGRACLLRLLHHMCGHLLNYTLACVIMENIPIRHYQEAFIKKRKNIPILLLLQIMTSHISILKKSAIVFQHTSKNVNCIYFQTIK